MKKSLLIIFVSALFIQNNIKAQEQAATTSRDAKRKIVPGIKVGINRSNVYNASRDAFAASNKQGFATGVFLALPLGGLFGFQPELVFQQKGFEGSGTLLGDHYVITRTTNHIDVPLQLQVKPFKWFTFLIGPNYSYMLSHDDNLTYVNTTGLQTRGFQSNNYRRSTFGTIIGFDLNFGHLVLSARSGWDATPSQAEVAAGEPNYRNRWIQGTVGYRFY